MQYTDDLKQALVKFGQGNEYAGFCTIRELADRIAIAREKHTSNQTKEVAISAILEEVEEFKRAVETETYERQRDEIIDVIVTAIRFLNGEYRKDNRCKE